MNDTLLKANDCESKEGECGGAIWDSQISTYSIFETIVENFI